MPSQHPRLLRLLGLLCALAVLVAGHSLGAPAPAAAAPLDPDPYGAGTRGHTRTPDGTLWFVDSLRAGKVTPAGDTASYQLPAGADARRIAAGPDGALWVTLYGKSAIARVTSDGQITEYRLPTADSYPYGITAGPDGALWFAAYGANRVGRITVAGAITEYPLPNPDSRPLNITAGSDGALWFTELAGARIGRITTAGAITEYTLPFPGGPGGSLLGQPHDITAAPGGSLYVSVYGASTGFVLEVTTVGKISVLAGLSEGQPFELTYGVDGAIWATEPGGFRLRRITMDGRDTKLPILADNSGAFRPYGILFDANGTIWLSGEGSTALRRFTTTRAIEGITTGPDGNFWIADPSTNAILRMTPAGAVTSLPLPTLGSLPRNVARGPARSLWYSAPGAGKVGQITRTLQIKEYAPPWPDSAPFDLAMAPDGTIWFSDLGANRIGAISTTGQISSYPIDGATEPRGIAVTPDGTVWFGLLGAVGKRAPDGTMTITPEPVSLPVLDIVAGPDGAVTYTIGAPGALGDGVVRISPNGARTSYGVGGFSNYPLNLALAQDGSAWLTLADSWVAHFTLAGEVVPYSLPVFESAPSGIAVAADGTIWTTDQRTNRVTQFTPGGTARGSFSLLGDGQYGELLLPEGVKQPGPIVIRSGGGVTGGFPGGIFSSGGSSGGTTPTGGSGSGGIARGSNDCIWVADQDISNGAGGGRLVQICPGNRLHAISATGDGALTYTAAGSDPRGLTMGPDGVLWVADYGANLIGRMSLAAEFTAYPLPTPGARPLDIVVGPDGALWFTEEAGNKIGRITTGGQLTEFAVPTAGSKPGGIAVGPDGALWFTEQAGNKIGRIGLDGQIAEFAVPTVGSRPFDIAAGLDGALWFTQPGADKVGRITPGGLVSEQAVPAGAEPYGIAAGTDGTIWFSERGANKLGQIAAAPVPSYALPVTPTGGGTVLLVPGGEICETTCGGRYPAGSQVTLLPVAPAGMRFVGWSGACSATGSCTLTLTGDAEVAAAFEKITEEPPPPPPPHYRIALPLIMR